jgi:autophagy-related protein 9
MQWSDVVDIIKTDRLNIHKKDVTALDVIQIMMRKDNYMIGMMNKGVLNYNLPCSNIQFVTQIFEWGLQLSLMNRAFDEFGVLRPEFRKFDKEYVPMVVSAGKKRANEFDIRVELVQMLKRRFFWIGLVFLVLSPFVLVALIIYVFFAYTAVRPQGQCSLHRGLTDTLHL